MDLHDCDEFFYNAGKIKAVRRKIYKEARKMRRNLFEINEIDTFNDETLNCENRYLTREVY